MKLTHLFTAITALTLAIPAFAEEDTPLEKEMEKIGRAIKVVNRNLADAAQKDANAAKIGDAIAACQASLKLEPKMAKDVPAAEKEKFIADYKTGIEAMSKLFTELKAAIEAGKTDEAAKLIEKLNAGKKEGHKKFQKED